MSDDEPRNVKDLLAALKDASELMVDLAYAAVDHGAPFSNIWLQDLAGGSRRQTLHFHQRELEVKKLQLQAPAKVNYRIDVLRKRPDGYHDLRMVMQRVNLCDEIELTLAGGQRIVAAITRESTQRLGLAVGSAAHQADRFTLFLPLTRPPSAT